MIRRTMIGTAAALLVFSLPVASAAAAPLSVARAIVAQDKIFIASPGYKLLEHFKVKTAAQAKVAIPELEHTRRLLLTAARVVSRSRARTTAEKTGRHYWVEGAHKVATGIGDLASGLEDLLKGDKAAGNKVLKLSVAVDHTGGKLAAKGDRLLGLPTSD